MRLENGMSNVLNGWTEHFIVGISATDGSKGSSHRLKWITVSVVLVEREAGRKNTVIGITPYSRLTSGAAISPCSHLVPRRHNHRKFVSIQDVFLWIYWFCHAFK